MNRSDPHVALDTEEGPEMGRWARWSASRQASAILAVSVALVVATSALLQGLGAPAQEPGPSASPGPTSAAASPSPAPTATPEPWTALEVPEIPAVADLSTLDVDAAGVQPSASFSLASLGGAPAKDLASRIEVQPPVALAVAPGADAGQAILRPEQPLTPGTVYRFSLRGAGGEIQGSWAFRVRSPLRVLSTIPGNETTNVPVERGIEFAFDQEGAADIAPYFSIDPAVPGRFERHGLTQVFVPDHLDAATLYTATLRAGLPRTGTDLTLEHDVVVRFETTGSSVEPATIVFGRDAVETAPDQVPVIGVAVVSDGSTPEPTSVDVVVRRYADEASAAAALSDFLLQPRWAQFSMPSLDSDGLAEVARFTAKLEAGSSPDARTIRFPEPLPAGWYAVELAGTGATAFLQVTRVSAWTAVLTDSTVAWVNDVVTGAAIAGATVAVRGASPFATADARGLAVGSTPDALVPPAEANGRTVPASPPLLVVRAPGGDSLLLALEISTGAEVYRGEWWEKTTSADQTYWALLYTDRNLYRRTDRIEAWGYLRARDGGAVPANLEIQVVDSGSAAELDAPALARAIVATQPTGAWLATVPIDGLPYGSYDVRVVANGRIVARAWVQVGAIAKPAYQLALSSDRSAVIAGTDVQFTVTATFFDGSPVPSLPLWLEDQERSTTVDLITGPDGTATWTLATTVDTSDPSEVGQDQSVAVRPVDPEEGELAAYASVFVFPSADHIGATGRLTASTLSVSGSAHAVDIARVDRELAAGTWDGDPNGAAIGGRTVTVGVTRLHQVRTQVGTTYDFIEKVSRPVYQYETIETELGGPGNVTSAADGSFSFSWTVPDPADQYRVTLRSKDAAGRVEARQVVVGQAVQDWWSPPQTSFVTAGGKQPSEVDYAVGDTVDWRITQDGTTKAAKPGERFLYVVAQRGLVDARTSTAARFTRTFAASDAPGVFIMGVRFTGTTYAPKAADWAVFRRSTRALTVTVTPDRAAYRPGDSLTLSIRTVGADGRPTAADVVLQAVDEKLFTMGAARVPGILDDLYAWVDSGIVRISSTHQLPSAGHEGEGGDTTGGGERTDFRDTLASRIVRTGADGLATTTIHLSDDLTSWHVVAAALTNGLQAGVGEVLVPVGLPLFADVTTAETYLASDRPWVRLRAFGTALSAGDPVVFTVAAPSLGMAPTEVRSTAFQAAWIELPTLAAGRHELHVKVVASTHTGAAGAPLADALVRPFQVVASRVTVAAAWYGTIGEALPTIDDAALVTYTFTDAGAARYLPSLLDASEASSLRLDSVLARDLALGLLSGRFGMDARTLPEPLDYERYEVAAYGLPPEERSGVALLPDAGPDLRLAARLAELAPGLLPTATLIEALNLVVGEPSLPRDLRIAALAGLASLGEPVDGGLREALAASDLTIDERIDLALGYLGIGDEATARSLERALLREHGQRLGGWVRIDAGSRDASTVATARLLVVAAGIGDPLAPAMADYVAANPSKETLTSLEIVAAARLALDRTPPAAARLAYTVEGTRTEASIEPGGSVRITLTAAQRRSLRLEQLAGSVAVVASWRRPVDTATMTTDPALGLTRIVPTKPVSPSAIVTVDLRTTIGPQAVGGGCYEVVEQAPSGLVPLAGQWSGATDVIWPTSVVGQEVRFTVSCGDAVSSGPTLRYVARVVNAGTFTWEPALMQHTSVATAAAASAGGTVTIATK
jgi:hypothetical protein